MSLLILCHSNIFKSSVIVFDRLIYNSNYQFANASVSSFKNDDGFSSFSSSIVYVYDVLQVKVCCYFNWFYNLIDNFGLQDTCCDKCSQW